MQVRINDDARIPDFVPGELAAYVQSFESNIWEELTMSGKNNMSNSIVTAILDIEKRYKELLKQVGAQQIAREDVEKLGIDIAVAMNPMLLRRGELSRLRGRP